MLNFNSVLLRRHSAPRVHSEGGGGGREQPVHGQGLPPGPETVEVGRLQQLAPQQGTLTVLSLFNTVLVEL